MSFTVTTRRPRGLGVMSPFVSTLTIDAGAAIHAAVRDGRFNSDALAPTRTAGTEPGYGSAPTTTTIGPDELSCDCLAKRAREALFNIGVDAPDLASAIAECENDPEGFALLTASLFPGGEVPACSWYEERTKRNIAIGVGLGVVVVGGIAVAMRRRRR